MFLTPYCDTIFNEPSLFDDLLWNIPREKKNVSKNWSITLNLRQFKPEEIKVNVSDDKSKVNVHAKHDAEDDFSEVKKVITIPDNVDKEQINTFITREGVLVVKAPYVQHKSQEKRQCHLLHLNPLCVPSWGRSLSKDMVEFQNDMDELIKQSFPGSMMPQYYKDEEGNHNINIDFPLQGYSPNEIKITHDDKNNKMVIEAKHENKTEDGSSSKFFRREFTLPKNIKSSELKSKLLDNGTLRLSAPCEFKDSSTCIEKKEEEIPIEKL
jgi:HSP20 family molecular chaperone IbpA